MANDNIYPPFRNPLGRPLKYTPEQLAEKFAEYVDWCKSNPIVVRSRVTYANGNYAENSEEKPRLISVEGFQLWIGVSERWWAEIDESKKGDTFSKVKSEIKKYCENYQKEMASSGLFKENIISRLLGLADRQKVDASVQTYDFKFGEGGEK